MKNKSVFIITVFFILLISSGLSNLKLAPFFVYNPGKKINIRVEFKNPIVNGSFGLVVRGEKDYDYGSFYRPESFDVEKGLLTDKNKNSGSYEAYKLSIPKYADKVADKIKYYPNWINVVYKFPSKEDYVLYTFEKNSLTKIGIIKSEVIKENSLTQIDEKLINPTKLEKETIYVFIPAVINVLGYQKINEGVNGVTLFKTNEGSLVKYTFDMPGVLFDAPADFTYSPAGWANRYPSHHNISAYYNPDKSLDVLWLDMTSNDIFCTNIDDSFNYKTKKMPLSLGRLGGFTKDEEGNFYYFTFGGADGQKELAVVKIDENGNEIYTNYLPTSEKVLNFHNSGIGTSRITYGYGMLGIMLEKGRFDGHQDANYCIVSADNGEILYNLGNVTSHSFDNRLYYYNDSFISINLGDNYPRGIRMRQTSPTGVSGSKVIYTFKSKHSTKSKGKLPAGKWSNDNETYTELGNILPSKSGYVVTFSSEKTADNKLAKKSLNESRNVGMVLVAGDFLKGKQTDYIVDKDIIISKGTDSNEFSLYTYGGKLVRQKYVGVVWLTEYKNMLQENASRVHTVKVSDDKFMIFWEKWTDKIFVESYSLIIDQYGKKLSDIKSLGRVRLPRGYEVFTMDGSPAWIIGNKNEKQLELYVYKLNDNLKNINKNIEKDKYILKPFIKSAWNYKDGIIEKIEMPDTGVKEGEEYIIKFTVHKKNKLRYGINKDGYKISNIGFGEKKSIGNDRYEYLFKIRPNEKGFYNFNIQAIIDKHWWSIYDIPIVVTKGRKEKKIYPELTDQYSHRQYKLISPLNGQMEYGKSYDFEIKVDDCDKVYITDDSGKKTEFEKLNNNLFKLKYKVPIYTEKIKLYAHFISDDKTVHMAVYDSTKSERVDKDMHLYKWYPVRGFWYLEDNNVIKQMSYTWDCLMYYTDVQLEDFTYELNTRRIESDDSIYINFRIKNDKNYYKLVLGGWHNKYHSIMKTVNGENIKLMTKKGSMENNRWYKVKITGKGSVYKILLDNEVLFEFNDSSLTGGYAGLGTWKTRAEYKDINIFSDNRKKYNKLEKLKLLDKSNCRILFASSFQDKTYAASNLLDGDKNTIWHTVWRGEAPKHPHEIVIDLGDVYLIKGAVYTPRQDWSVNGSISKYEIYFADKNKDWIKENLKGQFKDKLKTPKVLIMDKAVKVRYVKLRAVSEVNGKEWASGAEIDFVVE